MSAPLTIFEVHQGELGTGLWLVRWGDEEQRPFDERQAAIDWACAAARRVWERSGTPCRVLVVGSTEG